jgi:diguanylate cyclase (GGDEF)-like protein
MNGQEKMPDPLLELGSLTERRTRAGQLQHALRTALALTGGDAAVVLIPSARRTERLVMYSGSPAPALLPADPDGSTVARALAECGEPIAVEDLSEEAHLVPSDSCPGVEADPALFTALHQRDPSSGYLAVYRRRGRARFSLGEVRQMLLLAAWLGSALERLRLASGSEKLALGDDLTGVYNARFLKTALGRELRRAARFGQELSVVLVEVDRTAPAAERDGLRDGLLLRELATVLSQQVRSFDLLARHRADQFMFVLPQTGKSGAVEVAGRVRAMVEQHVFPSLPAGAVTVSLGVATFPQEGTDAKGLTATVERALALAHQRGMNRVETLDRRAA